MIMPNGEPVPLSELDRYGIERVPADVYVWQGFRYSNVPDALAAANRDAKS